MSSRAPAPVTVQDLHRFETLIDARSPAEFALDHLPGAINCPALDDEERRIVGTLYKQQGAFEARRVGGAMVAANLARHLQQHFHDRPADWKPLVYCWRGGLRSGSMVTWMRMVGWDAQQLSGGYKRWRGHVIDTLEQISPRLELRVISGPTGSGKTHLLHALARAGAQTIDLEGLARHRGSLLGALPGQPQPSQKGFETALCVLLQTLDPGRPVFIEAESRKIGQIAVPTVLLQRLREARCIELCVPFEERLRFLLQEYAWLGENPDTFTRQLDVLRPLHGHDTINRWQAWARQGALAPLFEELVRLHYDPSYARSQAAHLHCWPDRSVLELASLDAKALDVCAGQLCAGGA